LIRSTLSCRLCTKSLPKYLKHLFFKSLHPQSVLGVANPGRGARFIVGCGVLYVDVWFDNVLGTCCNKLLGTYALGSLYTTVCGIIALVAAIVLPPLAEAPIVVRLRTWWIGGTPMGTLGIRKSEKSSSVLSLEFSVLEVDALISLPENYLPNLASRLSKRELIVDSIFHSRQQICYLS
jgi:hypothetical protein